MIHPKEPGDILSDILQNYLSRLPIEQQNKFRLRELKEVVDQFYNEVKNKPLLTEYLLTQGSIDFIKRIEEHYDLRV